jgi:hypothetical protein
MFLELLFLENYEMLGDLWWALSLLLGCVLVFIPLFTTSMGNMSKGFTIIESSSGMRQGDPLHGPLFALAHYWTLLKTIAWTPNYGFPFLMDDTIIVGFMSEVVFTFDHLSTQLVLVQLRSRCQNASFGIHQGFFQM